MPSTPAIRTFLSTPHFAVIGAVPDPSRYGHKVFAWYHAHALPVTGIHPRTPTLLLPPSPTPHHTLPSVARLPSPPHTALSFVTPPAATLAVLREAAALGVRAVWFQPGAADEACLRFARGVEGMTVVGGGGGGECVLVHGEEGLGGVGRL
ncbi:CoA-binding protein [Morchella snyderi]|nr:CoA-binding protein [Morchella snyderi]